MSLAPRAHMHPVTKSFTAAFFVAGTLDFHGTSSNYLLYSSVESIKTLSVAVINLTIVNGLVRRALLRTSSCLIFSRRKRRWFLSYVMPNAGHTYIVCSIQSLRALALAMRRARLTAVKLVKQELARSYQLLSVDMRHMFVLIHDVNLSQLSGAFHRSRRCEKHYWLIHDVNPSQLGEAQWCISPI